EAHAHKFRTTTPSLIISTAALTLALGGGTYAAAAGLVTDQHIQKVVSNSTAANAKHLNGFGSNHFLPTRNEATSPGVHFLSAGQTVTLGHTGHFTFTSTCSKDSTGQNQVTFDVTADTT